MLRNSSLAARLGLAASLAIGYAGAVNAQAVNAQSASENGAEPQQETQAAANEPQPLTANEPAQASPSEPPAPPAAETATLAPEPAAPPAAAAVVEIDPLVAQVRQQLAASKLSDSTAAERAALIAFYADRKTPAWVTPAGLAERARHAMAEIAQADDWGLEAKAFALPVLAAGDTAPASLADAEIKLSVAVLKYARYARGGRMEPSQVSRNFDQKLTLRDPKVVLETVAGLETPGSYLRALHPKHPQFELLRQALLKLRSGAKQEEDTAEPAVRLPSEGPTLKSGVVHPDVALLRKRLNVGAPDGAENRFDEQVLAAVMDYQRKNGMRADGVVGAGTRAALNGGERSAPVFGTDEQRLIVNMERWRWVPEDMGEFHVWNNIPEYQTRVFKNGRVIHQAKIIVGKPDTQTTIFSANMRNIVFGPEWGVPDSIKVKEFLPYLRQTSSEPGFFGMGGGTVTDTRILERQNMRVVYNGRTVDASTIDFSQVDIRKFSFIQAAGPGNALGLVKFNFPNKHDIYMHDTPMRNLFDRSARAFSHGCMRVQNPGRFAEVLLDEDKGWPASRVRELMDRGGVNEVPLNKHIPVHNTYFTAVVSEDGQVRSFSDIYGHDKRVAAALSGRPMPIEPSQSLDTAQESSPAAPLKREARRGKLNNDQSNDDLFSSLFGN